MPGQPGTYELRYRFRDAETLLTRAITATDAELALTAPDAAPAGATIEVGWTGPDAPLDMIQVGPPGEAATADYAYTEGGNPLRLILPAQPGTYELRYRFQDAEVIFTRPIIVTAAEVSLSAPDSAPAGSLLPVGWVGPNAALDNIRIGKPGEGTVSYAYVSDGNPLQLRLPMAPGSYELHYNFRDREVIATRAIEVTAIGAQLIAQPSVPAGGMVTIGWDGPNYDIDYIAIGRVGEAGYDSYVHTSTGNPLTLTAPLTAGDYEIRYISGETMLVAVPLLVTAD